MQQQGISDRGKVVPEPLTDRSVPSSTYRIQFYADFGFEDARSLLSYLDELGIGTLYASPLFKARSGSTHGYDICDHNQLNPEIGTEMEFLALSDALRARGMGLLFDLVPNHMGVLDSANSWWMDVVENGPASRFASYFDINWHPIKAELENKLLLPVLEDQYGAVLESGKLQLCYEEGALFLRYYDIVFPLEPRSYRSVFTHSLQKMESQAGQEDEHVQELLSIFTALSYLPPCEAIPPGKMTERNREKEIIKRRISALYGGSRRFRDSIDGTLSSFNGDFSNPKSFDLLDELMNDQPYRLAFWRVATEEINYRRFFDVNHLAAIRVERPEVFQASHQLVLRLLRERHVTGLRIDHPDGLWNPSEYFSLLQRESTLPPAASNTAQIDSEIGESHGSAAPIPPSIPEGRAGSHCGRPLFVVVEKILSAGEALPEDWAVHGTTGYDFLNRVAGILVDSDNRRSLDRIYEQFSGRSGRFDDVIHSCKKMIMLVSMAAEINSLSYMLNLISEKNRRYRDFTLNSLTFAIREVIASLPVYRTYIRSLDPPAERDQHYIHRAVAEAARRNPRSPRALFDFILDTLLLRNVRHFHEEDRPRLLDFVMKLQQITGPVMAKGVEDTAFYVHNRLVSLNEVGGHPSEFGIPVSEFHRANLERRRSWPHSLLATSTHDTKRGEDVRARISVLSEIPGEWRAALTRWRRLNASRKTKLNGVPAPDANDEYLLYQTLLGAWPRMMRNEEEFASFRNRILQYMLKAAREAKVHTSWINANERYEQALAAFVTSLLSRSPRNRFLEDMEAVQRRVAFYGRINSLSQCLLKMTSPGIPDFYQGSELWDLSLVDPDNRRPVDYQMRREYLAELKSKTASCSGPEPLVRELLETADDGRIKMYLVHSLLTFRRAHRRLFDEGSYLPLLATGVRQDNVCAFARLLASEAVLTAAPRLAVQLTGGVEVWPLGEEVWRDTTLRLPSEFEGGGFYNLLTGETLRAASDENGPALPLGSVFRACPVAFLVSQRG